MRPTEKERMYIIYKKYVSDLQNKLVKFLEQE